MATKKTKPPILPRNYQDPTGADALERRVMKDFARRMNKIGKAYKSALDKIPSSLAVNARYEYQLNPTLLSIILNDASYLVDQVLLEGGDYDLWFYEYIDLASEKGTGQSFYNLSQQSPVYAAGRESLASILASDPYQQRMALVHARVFEEMKGLTADVKRDMARVLTDGVGRGLNPLDIARNLTDQTGIEKRRANRIARTEVTTALRRAKWDEDQEANDLYGLKTLLVHISALSPTTRHTHAVRHAHLYTNEEVRDWYSKDGNSINCYLPNTEVQGRFVAGSKSYYEGMVVKLVTRSGRNLTVTPNHPVMTNRGLIAANEVTERDNLFAYGSNVENPIGVSDLHNQHRVPVIQDVFCSLVESGHSIFRGVSAVDFHSDGSSCNGEVHIVRSNRKLSFACNTHAGEILDYFALKHANSVSSLIHGPSFSDLISVYLPSPDADGGSSDNAPVLERGGRKSVNCGSASSPALNSCDFKAPLNNATGNANFSGDSLFGDSGLIEPDDVVGVERYFFEGHVYDLEEVSGLMIANGIIASNCKCSQQSVLVNDEGEPEYPDTITKLKQEYKSMQARGYAWAEK
ncbi:phage minor head protein [Enterobacter hormaechei subsp. xiangfangensis]|nr:phage minor head protein [Enterobacter hormaechei]UUQ71175.1 phage minor head protein [Enterobacter hormaechei subsp. xiangfangensis]